MTTSNDCFCGQLSRDAGEDLFGTASTVGVWLLLEYSGRWGEDAFGESELPPPVKERLAEWLNLRPRPRLLLIKQRERKLTGMAFYVALSRETNSALYEFRLNSYADLLDLDIAAVLQEAAEYAGQRGSQPLFLVCTHGVHDKCCAKYGRPVYAAMAERDDVVVWQSSHVGGDRFAANVVCLPQGIYYGRVDQERDVEAIVGASNMGVVHLERYRGRSCYSFVVQAAEYYIREQTGALRIDALRLLDAEQTQRGRWTVRFRSTADRLQYTVRVARENMGMRNFLVCKAEEQSDLVRYRLDGYEVENLLV